MFFRTFGIPFKNKTVGFLCLGALCLSLWQISQTVLKIFPAVPSAPRLPVYMITGLAGFAVLAALPGFFVRLIKQAGTGEDVVFGWRDFSDVQNGILSPAFKFLLIVFWSFLPIELYSAITVKNQVPISLLAIILLLSLSFIYFPMAFLMMAITDKVMPSLLPSNVIEPIFKSFKRYLLFLILFWVLLLLPLATLFFWPIPYIGPLISSFILLYLWTSGIHLLGRFYFHEKELLTSR